MTLLFFRVSTYKSNPHVNFVNIFFALHKNLKPHNRRAWAKVPDMDRRLKKVYALNWYLIILLWLFILRSNSMNMRLSKG